MNYNEDIMIRTRVTREMRDEFKLVATKNGTSMSDLIRGWITDYVATHNDVATDNIVATHTNVATTNNIATDNDVAIDNIVATPLTELVSADFKALCNIQVIDVATQEIVATYNPGQLIKRRYVGKNYDIKEMI